MAYVRKSEGHPGIHPTCNNWPKKGRKQSRVRGKTLAKRKGLEMSSNWRKASRSFSTRQCAEVGNEAPAYQAFEGKSVLIRDSVDKGGTILRVSHGGWKRFTDRIKTDKIFFAPRDRV